ncbi:uncharacterized protein LOC106653667 isoform X2 [Trichogramma pretiosum]|uniref:uncharacterized protein LOC106653667 isoform X2 n=1 Tax=Trichogramma pretiosum TaxID=7493 RepID=UPI000C71980E|nr:uncharacterized protein LOC106653667 isoform X2 [Trichogramma pretiosum]
MEALLPSEIARLVLGYLQEQCEEAGKIFMDTCPLLQECRIVKQRGGRYSTKVGGLNLVEILDKYCAANALVQEKLSKVDSEQVKQCNDLLEQLRYLLEETRGNRFVVNIKVPSQNSQGPLANSSNSKKKQHSSIEKTKRGIPRILSNVEYKSNQKPNKQICDNSEMPPMGNLPIHVESTESTSTGINNHNGVSNNHTFYRINEISVPKSNEIFYTGTEENSNKTSTNVATSINVNSNTKDQATVPVQFSENEQISNKRTAETSTDELRIYSSAEVQTFSPPLDQDQLEPASNLSFFTKKLLKREELIERIAENACKAINSTKAVQEDKNIHDKTKDDHNASLLTEFDNAIKNAVETTHNDPVFEKFLTEIFNTGDGDVVPTTCSEPKKKLSNRVNDVHANYEFMDIDNNCVPFESQLSNVNVPPVEANNFEIPLKQRLRSSSKTFNIADEEEKDANSRLDDQNAEAIMNIVKMANSNRNNNLTSMSSEITTGPPENAFSDNPLENYNCIEVIPAPVAANSHNSPNKKQTKSRKGPVRKHKPSRPKPPVKALSEEAVQKQRLADQAMDTMPTLILCSEEEMSVSTQTKNNSSSFLPIAPKIGLTTGPVVESESNQPKLFFRTVNVPRHLLNPPLMEIQSKIICQPKQNEAITLYANDEQAQTVAAPVTSIIPPITCEESSLSFTGTGLSPFFKSLRTERPKTVEDNNQEPVVIETIDVEIEEMMSTNNEKIQAIEPVSEIVTENQQVTEKKDSTESQPSAEKYALSLSTVQEVPSMMEQSTSEVIVTAATTATTSADSQQKSGGGSDNKPAARIAAEQQHHHYPIVKRTPQSMRVSRTNPNPARARLSLSTPRRRERHVRALDFDTPKKGCGPNGEPRDKDASSSSGRRLHAVCRAGLFTSPPDAASADNNKRRPVVAATATTGQRKIRTLSPVQYQRVPVPIATRSPAPKLQGNWNKVTGIGLILGESESSMDRSTEYSQGSAKEEEHPQQQQQQQQQQQPKQTQEAKKYEEKKETGKSWDSDLRKIIGAGLQEEPKIKRKRTRKRSKPDDTDGESPKKTGKTPKKRRGKTLSRSNSNVETQPQSDNESSAITKNSNKPDSGIESSTIATDDAANNKENTVKNREAELEILAGRVITYHLPSLGDIVTPSKNEMTVPPTPKILTTPGDHVYRPTHLTRSIRGLGGVPTPDFPKTPQVIITPDKNRSTAYYEPSEEALRRINEIAKENHIKMSCQDKKPQEAEVIVENGKNDDEIEGETDATPQKTSPKDRKLKDASFMSSITSSDTSHNTTGSNANTSSSLSEDTTANTSKELSADDIAKTSPKQKSANDSRNESQDAKEDTQSPEKEGQDDRSDDSDSESDDDDRSGSNSDSSTSSSTSSSSSSSSASRSSRSSSSRSGSDSENSPAKSRKDSIQEDDDNVIIHHDQPASPENTFPIYPEEDDPKETPAKEENVAEAEISETPSVTVADRALRRDSLTNLNAKISAAIVTTSSSGERSVSSPKKKSETKPNHAGVTKAKISNVPKMSPMSNAKISRQLEEKRLRVLAKFKAGNAAPTKVVPPKKPANKVLKARAALNNVKKEAPKKAATKTKAAASPKKKSSAGSSSPSKVAANERESAASKVEQVKRDLFSGDEGEQQQRTTRSQTNARKSVDAPSEDLQVLECLELRPANKSDLDASFRSSDSNSNIKEEECVYDDSKPIKKRKLQCDGVKLDEEYTVGNPDNEGNISVTTLKVTPFILLNSPPAANVSPKRSQTKPKDKGLPLATSSPKVKSTSKSKHKKPSKKSEKSKLSPTKKSTETKDTPKPDSLNLLGKNISLEEFLKKVHNG